MIRLQTVAVAVALALPMASAQADTNAVSPLPEAITDTPVGTWQLTITTFNCQTAVPNPPFQSLLSFEIEGNEIETTNNPMLQSGQRTPAFGTWHMTGPGRAVLRTQAFILFPSPAGPIRQGSQTIRHDIRMTSSRHFADFATITYQDMSGHVTLTGCATAAGERL